MDRLNDHGVGLVRRDGLEFPTVRFHLLLRRRSYRRERTSCVSSVVRLLVQVHLQVEVVGQESRHHFRRALILERQPQDRRVSKVDHASSERLELEESLLTDLKDCLLALTLSKVALVSSALLEQGIRFVPRESHGGKPGVNLEEVKLCKNHEKGAHRLVILSLSLSLYLFLDLRLLTRFPRSFRFLLTSRGNPAASLSRSSFSSRFFLA